MNEWVKFYGGLQQQGGPLIAPRTKDKERQQQSDNVRECVEQKREVSKSYYECKILER